MGSLDQPDFGLSMAFAFLLFVMSVVWIFLPFAIFGIKDLLRRLIEEMRRNTAELKVISSALAADRADREAERRDAMPDRSTDV